MNEFDVIEYLKQKITHDKRIPVGIGDDAAVLNVTPGKQLVVSTDAIVEGVDFVLDQKNGGIHPPRNLADEHPRDFLSPEQIGRKVLAINLSDLAAMGAKPMAFVITIGKPRHISLAWLKRFYNGLLKLARQHNVACVGGDFSGSKEFFASVTIFGECLRHHVIARSGAMAGDWIAVTGALGGSRLRHHYDFTPRIREGLFLAGHFTPTAMIDISDGLCQDLGHVLKASRVGAVLELDKIPISRDAKTLAFRDRPGKTKWTGPFHSAVKRALSDGEDFELLFTVPPWQKIMLDRKWKKHFPKVPLTWIGKIEGKLPKIRWTMKGKVVSVSKSFTKGFSHF